MDAIVDAERVTHIHGRAISSADVRAHVGILGRASQELHVHKRRDERLRGHLVEAPEALHLGFRQAQARTLHVLGAYQLEPLGEM